MHEITSSEEVKKLLRSSKPVVMFFYLTGCPHCERMDPICSELEKEVPSMKFVKVESANVPSELGITGFPKFIKVEDGKQVATADGEMTKEELKSKLVSGGRRRRSSRAKRTRRKHAVYRSTRRHIPFRTKFSSTR